MNDNKLPSNIRFNTFVFQEAANIAFEDDGSVRITGLIGGDLFLAPGTQMQKLLLTDYPPAKWTFWQRVRLVFDPRHYPSGRKGRAAV